MANNLFEEFKSIFENDSKIQITSPYMINRLMSFTIDGFFVASILNKYIGRIPNELIFFIYKKYIGKKNAPWTNYPKRLKENKELLDRICTFHNCNMNRGRQIINLYRRIDLNPEAIFGVNKK